MFCIQIACNLVDYFIQDYPCLLWKHRRGRGVVNLVKVCLHDQLTYLPVGWHRHTAILWS